MRMVLNINLSTPLLPKSFSSERIKTKNMLSQRKCTMKTILLSLLIVVFSLSGCVLPLSASTDQDIAQSVKLHQSSSDSTPTSEGLYTENPVHFSKGKKIKESQKSPTEANSTEIDSSLDVTALENPTF